MSEQRIDTGADAATGTDADPGEGLGLSDHADPLNPGGSAGSDADMPQPTADRPGGGTADTADSAETEGASHLRDTQARAGGTPDLSGRMPTGTDQGGPAGSADSGGSDGPGGSAGSGGSSGSGDSGGAAGRPSTERTGEIGSEPREHRREVDPGSVATEFGDRADEAPDDDIAHPTI